MDLEFLSHYLLQAVKKKLVLFDFDGTITTKDTFLEFIIFYHGSFKFLSGFSLLSPILILHLLKVVPNWRAKEFVLAWFFKNESEEYFNNKCDQFCREIVPSLVRKQALETLRAHQAKGQEVVVVSASAENWVRPWCNTMDVTCIATRLEVVNGKLTGKILKKNCYGEEKVCRLKEEFNITDFDSIIAYGDSSGDRQMLSLAQEQFYKPFRGKAI
jgi:HAD superfamily hydrolase (TIGR01490 family)